MSHRLIVVCLSLLALLLSPVSHAQVTPLPGGPKVTDCSKARDPARCEARIEARLACRDKRGDNKRICMEAHMVSPDCAHADNPKRCANLRQAEQACKQKHGQAHKNCVQAQLKKKAQPRKAAPKSTTPNTATPQ